MRKVGGLCRPGGECINLHGPWAPQPGQEEITASKKPRSGRVLLQFKIEKGALRIAVRPKEGGKLGHRTIDADKLRENLSDGEREKRSKKPQSSGES